MSLPVVHALHVACAVLSSHNVPSSPTAPQNPPHNVKVERINGTTMNVSFTRLSIVEAEGLSVAYTIRYSPQISGGKRQAPSQSMEVPDGQSHLVVGGLDPKTTYDVEVVVSANGVDATSDRVSAPVPPGTRLSTHAITHTPLHLVSLFPDLVCVQVVVVVIVVEVLRLLLGA